MIHLYIISLDILIIDKEKFPKELEIEGIMTNSLMGVMSIKRIDDIKYENEEFRNKFNIIYKNVV